MITRSRDHEEENGVEDNGDKDVAKMHEEEAHMNVRTETLWKGGEGAGDNIALKETNVLTR